MKYLLVAAEDHIALALQKIITREVPGVTVTEHDPELCGALPAGEPV